MTVFIELTTSAFARTFKDRAARGGVVHRGAGADSVRRPLRGLEIKSDTHAVIRVLKANGQEINLVSSSYRGGKGPAYTNFILQNITESRQEKSQIIETFGDDYVFFFGERPRTLAVSAMLLNSLDFNWEAEFWKNYDLYLRGTRCAEIGARIYMFYDDNVVEGYMLQATAVKDASNTSLIQLQFSLLLTNYSNLSFIESSTYPYRSTIPLGDLDGQDPAEYQVIGLDPSENPEWLQLQPVPTREQALRGADIKSHKRRELPYRSDITDNVDEWTGDRYSLSLDGERAYALQREEADRLSDKLIREACQRGAIANNPSFLQTMGLAGIGASGIINAQVGGHASLGAGAFAGAGIGASAGAGAYAGAGAWAGTKGSGTWSKSSSGAGAGYYAGAGVGYNSGNIGNQGGSIGYYAGAGYYGPGQSGAQGYGSGTAPASQGYYAGAGAGVGWTPGQGVQSGSYKYSGQSPPDPNQNNPWSPSPSAGASGGASAGYSGGFFGGRYGAQGYASAGYAASSGGGTAQQQYYAGAYAGWDPVNGSTVKSWSGRSPEGHTGIPPGQPGGGLFGTFVFSGNLGGGGLDPNTGKPWSEHTSKGPYPEKNPAPNPYGLQIDEETCEGYRNFDMGD